MSQLIAPSAVCYLSVLKVLFWVAAVDGYVCDDDRTGSGRQPCRQGLLDLT